MDTLRDYVAHLTDDEKIQCIKDYLEYEKRGMIGDCLLRTKVNDMMDQLIRDPAHNAWALWAEKFISEIFRHFALIHIDPETN